MQADNDQATEAGEMIHVFDLFVLVVFAMLIVSTVWSLDGCYQDHLYHVVEYFSILVFSSQRHIFRGWQLSPSVGEKTYCQV